jgi:di/tricarboxylate transporter
MAMAFAFLIGCLLQGQTAAAVFGYWPDSIAFFLIAACLFFGFAQENGTLALFGNKLAWLFRKNLKLVPFAIYLIAMIMGLLGAGSATMVIVTPIAFSIGMVAKVDPMMITLCVNMGYISGSYNPWTGSGVILYELIEQNAENAFAIYIRSYATFLVKQVIFLAIFFVFYTFVKKKKGSALQEKQAADVLREKPADFTPLQKKTLFLILLCFSVIVVPNMIDTWFHFKNAFFVNLINLCKPQSILVIFALVASIMNLADTKKVINRLPMNTTLMIVGMCFLMEIAKKADLIKTLTGMFSDTLPVFLVPPLLCVLASFLSIFSSANSVVCPLLFPMVPAMSLATGINPVCLFSAIMIGADATSISPFSTSGSQMLAFAPDDQKESMIPRMINLTFVVLGLSALLALFGLYDIFRA